MNRFLIAAIAIFSMTPAMTVFASPRIEIEPDTNDCVSGWMSMDVTVKVDGENFQFNPSCNFSFDDRFTTSSGVACTISAGMCSMFSPKNKIEVTCDGATESAPVLCP